MDKATIEALERRVPRYTSYPTAPQFSPAFGPSAFGRALGRVRTERPVSLYIHVPFCTALCWYCGCNTRVARNNRPIEDYLAMLGLEVKLVADALPGRVTVGHLHLGGGTPNRLRRDHLDRLWRLLGDHFTLAPDAEISVELDPRQLDADEVDALVALGVTRVSLGVQDFDERVQSAINRIQPFDVVAAAVGRLRYAGITAINFDLMYGLPLQTVESVVRSARLAASLAPSRIALFGYAHVPWLRRHQAQIADADLPRPEQRAEQERASGDTLLGLGYERIGLDHFALPGDSLAATRRAGKLRRNFQGYTTDPHDTLIGIGPSSISNLPDAYFQNHVDPAAVRAALRRDLLPVARGIELSDEDLFRRAIIERLMCDLEVDIAALADRHGFQTDEVDLRGVDGLVAQGVCRRDGFTITVPEANRRLVRLVCAEFDTYLQGQGSRYSLAV